MIATTNDVDTLQKYIIIIVLLHHALSNVFEKTVPYDTLRDCLMGIYKFRDWKSL